MPDGETQINRKKQTINFINKILTFFSIKRKNDQINSQPKENLFDSDEVKNNISHYENLCAEDIMIPRTDIVGIANTLSLQEIIDKFLETRHTRMPIYRGDLNNVIGFINIKDILPFVLKNELNLDFKIEKVIREILFIPPSMRISNLLEKMRQSKTHIALVIDELGGADGLITIEDLIEEIIGEIEDEHDSENNVPIFKKIDSKTYEVSGRSEIEELENELGLKLTSDEIESEYDTIGGLILSISSYVPNKGDKIIHPSSKIIFEIIDADLRRIKTVRIHLQ